VLSVARNFELAFQRPKQSDPPVCYRPIEATPEALDPTCSVLVIQKPGDMSSLGFINSLWQAFPSKPIFTERHVGDLSGKVGQFLAMTSSIAPISYVQHQVLIPRTRSTL
jgi:hypothetical protein